MANEILTCAEGVTAERLSALRDDALPTAEAQRLRVHVMECAACRARLADYDAIAGVLRSQRELEPGDRIARGVGERLAAGGRRLGGGSSRRLWAGIAALAPVAALILLFVYVFTGVARRPATTTSPATATVSATATPPDGKRIVPTATPALVTVPSFTSAISATAAWGTVAPVAQYTFAASGSQPFIPQTFSADLTTVGGVLYSGSNGNGSQTVQLALYDTATGAITRLSPTWRGYAPSPWGAAQMVDSRYVVYAYNTQPGGTCGVCNSTVWALDRQSGQTWRLNTGDAIGDLGDLVSGDYVAFTSVDNQVWVADLAAHQVTLTLPIGAQPVAPTANSTTPEPDDRVLGFQWPYLIYQETPPGTPDAQGNGPATTLNILNLSTHQNTRISAPLPTGSDAAQETYTGAVLNGTTLYLTTYTGLNGVDAQGQPVNLNYNTLYALTGAFSSGGQFTRLARWEPTTSTFGQMFINARLIALGGSYFWDLQEQRLVNTAFVDASHSAQMMGASLIVAPLVPAPGGVTAPPYHVTVYDTSAFPVLTPGG